MDYISVKEFAQKYGVSERTARNYCASGKIEGVVLVGKTWNIPADATLPMRKSKKQQVSPLLSILREQKNMKLKGGIYEPIIPIISKEAGCRMSRPVLYLKLIR